MTAAPSAPRATAESARLSVSGGQTENLPLTAIRGFAALWVVGVHLEEGWAFPVGPHIHNALVMGRVAVDIFFVLSGFILTLVYRDLVGPGSGAFALRRIFRIYPLHLCIIVVLGLAGLYTQVKYGEVHPWNSYWPAVLLIQPFLGMMTAWNIASWSLGVEFLCYAVFPLGNRILRPVKAPGLIGTVVAMVAIEALVLHYYDNVVIGPGAMARALGGFFLGSVLARLFLLRGVTHSRYAGPLQLGAVGTLAIAILADNDTVAVVAAAVLITAIAWPKGPVVRLLSTRICVWVGQVSFSIYLLHLPLMAVFEKVPPLRAALAIPSRRFGVAAIFLAVLMVLSGATYHLIERPFRRVPALLERRAARTFQVPAHS